MSQREGLGRPQSRGGLGPAECGRACPGGPAPLPGSTSPGPRLTTRDPSSSGSHRIKKGTSPPFSFDHREEYERSIGKKGVPRVRRRRVLALSYLLGLSPGGGVPAASRSAPGTALWGPSSSSAPRRAPQGPSTPIGKPGTRSPELRSIISGQTKMGGNRTGIRNQDESLEGQGNPDDSRFTAVVRFVG